VWKKAPFLRLFIFLVIGILLQWQFQLNHRICLTFFISSILLLFATLFLPPYFKFKFILITAIPIVLLCISLGAILAYTKDIRHNPQWFGNYLDSTKNFIAVLKEAPIEKQRSFKVKASIEGFKGNIIIYFQKNSNFSLQINSRIIFKKHLQETGNIPGQLQFNYKRYCLFNGITHQVYLRMNEYVVLPVSQPSSFDQFLYRTKSVITGILKKNIPGHQESGLGEALLLGYKNDLDRSLVQSYSNVGVVHIIAISGLHLGLIYWILLLIFKPFTRFRKLKWISPLLSIICLWLFSLLAGAQPSVLRAAFMFTILLTAEMTGKKSSIINSLALSAFLLLCINPFWLWDIGFQLSYAAVLSIVLFMQPIYSLFYVKNKWLDMIWKLNAVTISAQILTTPLSIYHFHQFPNFFLLSNCIAVPLSSLVLFSEIALCIFYMIPLIAIFLGKVSGFLIGLMNQFVEWMDKMPGAVSRGLEMDVSQTILLYIIITALTVWIFFKKQKGVLVSLYALLIFMIIRAVHLSLL
jgi:competence protein ComEC